MADSPTVTAIVGSRRPGSYTRVALTHALSASRDRGADTSLIDLRERSVPPLDPSEDPTTDVRVLREQLHDSDAIILGTPMYHGSYSGVLKNAIDHCGFDEFEDTTIGLLAVSGGRFPVSALEHLRSVCRALNAWVLPYEAAIPQADSNVSDGQLTDETLRSRVETLGTRVVEYARITPHQESFEGDENVGAGR